MASKTKSNALYNNTNSNIDANIAKGKPIQELFNYEGKRSELVKCSKRTKQTKRTKQIKRRKKLLTTEKGINA